MENKPTKGYHYFASSVLHWTTNEDLLKCLEIQKKRDKSIKSFKVPGCVLFKVPVPESAEYIIDNYMPQVEGTEKIDEVRY